MGKTNVPLLVSLGRFPAGQGQGAGRFDAVAKRIREKLSDYGTYNFSPVQSTALNIFFDLAQEFPGVQNALAVCVLVPKLVLDLECALYLLDENQNLALQAATREGNPHTLEFRDKPTLVDGDYCIPIKGNHDIISELPFEAVGDFIGMLAIHPGQDLTDHDRLFLCRYANRLGFQLNNRYANIKNKEHVQFICSLVKDIGHNVIVPNMYFKLFYKRLEARINLIKSYQLKLQRFMDESIKGDMSILGASNRLLQEIEYIHGSIQEQFKEIFSHYQNTSLFLETLLRRSHFEEGRYVLEKRKCNLKSQVIDPQVERYRARLQDRGIEIDTSMGGVPDREMEMVVDVGLISQVFANLVSNVVKYAREVNDGGVTRKFMSYGWEVLKDRFGPGLDGIKLNVFSTGPPLDPEDSHNLYTEGYRGENAQSEYGTGHGLYFIREVVKLHGGESGYEPTPLGNNFFFILPLEPVLPAGAPKH